MIGVNSSVRVLGLGAALAGAFVVAATALAAGTSASFTDAAGDANEAPDITSVTVSDAVAGQVTVRVAVRNLPVLPSGARVLLRFDLDNDPATGAAGDEAAAGYSSDGTLAFFRWNGSELAPASASGMVATFADSVLTFTAARAQLAPGPFGIVAITLRNQTVGEASVISTDFAPVGGRSVYSSTGEVSFPDPQDDEDVAPDITAMSISDARNGIITFRVTTSNYQTLPVDKLIGFGFSLVGRPAAENEVFVTFQGGPGTVDIERENGGVLSQDAPPNKVTFVYANGVLTLGVHRSELDNVAAFKVGVITADLTGDGEGEGEDAIGNIEAVDVAPEGLPTGESFSYNLANPPPVTLSTGRPAGAPASPRSGKPFAVSVVVTRSDTGKIVRAGKVTCTASVGTTHVPAAGRFRDGKARCSLVVPAEKRAARVRGAMTIRAAGASVRSSFSFVVR